MPKQIVKHLCWPLCEARLCCAPTLTSVSLSVSVGSKDGVTAAAERAFMKLYILSIMNVLSYPHHMCNVTKPTCLSAGWVDGSHLK